MSPVRTPASATRPPRLFGTDGMRGLVNQEPITAATVLAVAMAAGATLPRTHNHTPRVVIGKDTRLGNYMLEAALEAGFTSMGMEVVLLGPAPTPAVSMLTRSMRADLGVMISASHNPYHDSGLKFFASDGYKLADQKESEIATKAQAARRGTLSLAAGEHLGRARRLDDAIGRYIEYAKNSFPSHLSLEGCRLVLDCANGAAYKVAPTVFRELGAEVHLLSAAPDGRNINANCGAVYPEAMCRETRRVGARLGIALDGDADRVIFSDERGRRIDGDQVLALVARSWAQAGRLTGGAIVATDMSNLGLEHYLAELGLGLKRAPVGDRYVLEAMRRYGCNLGGEESGHVILSDLATTGDGVIAALQVLAVLLGNRRHKASAAFRLFDSVPQVRRNLVFASQAAAETCAASAKLRSARVRAEGVLQSVPHRVLVRASGTEPLLRIMIECQDKLLAEQAAGMLEQEAQAQIRSTAGSKTKTKTKPKIKIKAKTKAKAKPKAKTKTKPKVRAKAKPKTKSKTKPKAKAKKA